MWPLSADFENRGAARGAPNLARSAVCSPRLAEKPFGGAGGLGAGRARHGLRGQGTRERKRRDFWCWGGFKRESTLFVAYSNDSTMLKQPPLVQFLDRLSKQQWLKHVQSRGWPDCDVHPLKWNWGGCVPRTRAATRRLQVSSSSSYFNHSFTVSKQ